MTGNLQSFCFRIEKEFGKPNKYTAGDPDENVWIACPPGSFINTQHNRAVTRINTAGSKVWDTVAYGQLTGSFEWTFQLDYAYLEPIYLLFEKFHEDVGEVSSTHYYDKKNVGRVPSFTIRRKVINRSSGGSIDEMEDIYGCVARNITFSKSAGTSQINVRITGFFVDERMVLGYMDSTDYTEYNGKLAEFLCMFVGDSASDALADCHYVANTESLEVTIENSAEAIYNTCSPFASAYVEGITNYSFTTSCLANNPDNYRRRVYSGGNSKVNRPLAKGLTPLKKIFLVAYDGSARGDDDDPNFSPSEDDIKAAINSSGNKLVFEIDECVIKSLTWPKGDGSIIMDNISSAECKRIKLDVTTGSLPGSDSSYRACPAAASTVAGVRNRITSYEPSPNATGLYDPCNTA